jgi:hypothetical protein
MAPLARLLAARGCPPAKPSRPAPPRSSWVRPFSPPVAPPAPARRGGLPPHRRRAFRALPDDQTRRRRSRLVWALAGHRAAATLAAMGGETSGLRAAWMACTHRPPSTSTSGRRHRTIEGVPHPVSAPLCSGLVGPHVAVAIDAAYDAPSAPYSSPPGPAPTCPSGGPRLGERAGAGRSGGRNAHRPCQSYARPDHGVDPDLVAVGVDVGLKARRDVILGLPAVQAADRSVTLPSASMFRMCWCRAVDPALAVHIEEVPAIASGVTGRAGRRRTSRERRDARLALGSPGAGLTPASPVRSAPIIAGFSAIHASLAVATGRSPLRPQPGAADQSSTGDHPAPLARLPSRGLAPAGPFSPAATVAGDAGRPIRGRGRAARGR